MLNWEKADDTELVCYCIEVNKKSIVDAIKAGKTTLTDIKESTSACTGSSCKELNPLGKCCSKDINKLIQLYFSKDSANNCSCCT